MRSRLSALAIAVATCAALACKGTEPLTPTSITVKPVSPVMFSALGETRKLSATILDQHGDSMTGQPITWTIGSILVATVDTSGLVTARGNGATSVTATAGSVHQQIAISVAQAAASDSKRGDGQVADTGATLATPLGVLVLDVNGNPVAGVAVTFTAGAGNGSVSPTTTTTGGSGVAYAAWTLANTASTQTVTATAGALAPLTFTATAMSNTTAAGFQIVVVNAGPPLDAATRSAFDSAAAFWQRAITGDIPDYPGFASGEGDCGTGTPAVGPINLDDVVIMVRVQPIDGAGGVLASSGPCYVRVTGGQPWTLSFPLLGTITIDAADAQVMINNGTLVAVLKHEMAHVLGFGSYWPAVIAAGQLNGFGCLQSPSSAGSNVDTYYSCTRGRTVFDSIGGIFYNVNLKKVPVENCAGITGCGAGTYNSHWRKSVFGNELMTGYLVALPAPLSVLTLASMQDLGYTVDFTAAESYTRDFAASPAPASAAAAARLIDLGDDAAHIPIHLVDRRGRVVGVIQPR